MQKPNRHAVRISLVIGIFGFLVYFVYGVVQDKLYIPA